MSNQQHQSWSNFERNTIVEGEQRSSRICSRPDIQLYYDDSYGRLGLLIESEGEGSICPDIDLIAAMGCERASIEEKSYLRLWTSSRTHFQQFYALALSACDHVVVHGMAPEEAINHEVGGFRELLEQQQLLSIECQIGLVGELLVLSAVLQERGVNGFDAWLGPMKEPHDFLFGTFEVEVKTTLKTRRIHTIHGLKQLVPSPGFTLHVVSIMLGPAGDSEGLTLPSLILAVRSKLSGDQTRLKSFETCIRGLEYQDADARHYQRRHVLRNPAAVVPVDSQFPAVNSDAIEKALGAKASRVDNVQYDVNLEGLGRVAGESAKPNDVSGLFKLLR